MKATEAGFKVFRILEVFHSKQKINRQIANTQTLGLPASA